MAAVAVVALVAAGVSFGQSGALAVTGCDASLRFDVNGDGVNDLAIGSPGEDIGSGTTQARDAGMVSLVYGSKGAFTLGWGGGSRLLSQEDLGQASEAGDAYGSTLVTGDVNGDGCDDLAIGMPGENDGAGRVMVVFGSPTGMNPASRQVLDQATPGVPGGPEGEDGFGTSLAITGGEIPALWVGSPGESVGEATAAGTITRFPLGTAGSHLPTTGIRSLSEDSAGVPGGAEAYDGFGAVLSGSASSLLVGVPHEGVGTHQAAGSVYAYDGRWKTWTQDSPGISGGAESDDHFGAAVTQLPCAGQAGEVYVAGAPGEDIGTHADTGTVTLVGAAGATTLSQDSPGVPGKAEGGDRLGRSLDGIDGDLAVGAPGENDATGDVLQLSLDCAAAPRVVLSAAVWSYAVDTGDYFGSVVTFVDVTGVTDGPILVAGAPLDGEIRLSDSGTVTSYSKRDTSGFFTAGGSLLQQQKVSGLSEDGDHFGAALAGAS